MQLSLIYFEVKFNILRISFLLMLNVVSYLFTFVNISELFDTEKISQKHSLSEIKERCPYFSFSFDFVLTNHKMRLILLIFLIISLNCY